MGHPPRCPQLRCKAFGEILFGRTSNKRRSHSMALLTRALPRRPSACRHCHVQRFHEQAGKVVRGLERRSRFVKCEKLLQQPLGVSRERRRVSSRNSRFRKPSRIVWKPMARSKRLTRMSEVLSQEGRELVHTRSA